MLWTEAFHQRQSARLSRIAAKMKLPGHLIEEAVQEVWPKIVRQWQSVRGPDEMRRFLALSRKIMHDTVADMLRRRDRHRSVSLYELPAEPMDGKTSDPAELLAAKEIREWMVAKVEEVWKNQPNYGWLLSEHFLKERSLEELAARRR